MIKQKIYLFPYQVFVSLFFLSIPLYVFGVDVVNKKNNDTLTDTDRFKPIEITANSVFFNKNIGLSVYTGNVRIIQGSLQLKGEKVKLRNSKQKIQKLTANGSPAYFKKYLSKQKKWIEGKAKEIYYDAKKQKVRLFGNAYLKQGENNTVTGHELIYDLKDSTLNANSDKNNNKPVHIILNVDEIDNPEKVKKDN